MIHSFKHELKDEFSFVFTWLMRIYRSYIRLSYTFLQYEMKFIIKMHTYSCKTSNIRSFGFRLPISVWSLVSVSMEYFIPLRAPFVCFYHDNQTEKSLNEDEDGKSVPSRTVKNVTDKIIRREKRTKDKNAMQFFLVMAYFFSVYFHLSAHSTPHILMPQPKHLYLYCIHIMSVHKSSPRQRRAFHTNAI